MPYPDGAFTHNPNYDPDYDSADDLDVGSEDDYDEDVEGEEGAEMK